MISAQVKELKLQIRIIQANPIYYEFRRKSYNSGYVRCLKPNAQNKIDELNNKIGQLLDLVDEQIKENEMENTLNIEYTVSMIGTAAFPIWAVWKCYVDADGYELEHLTELVFKTPSKQQAYDFCNVTM